MLKTPSVEWTIMARSTVFVRAVFSETATFAVRLMSVALRDFGLNSFKKRAEPTKTWSKLTASFLIFFKPHQTHNCDPNATCSDVPGNQGGFECSCNWTWQGNGTHCEVTVFDDRSFSFIENFYECSERHRRMCNSDTSMPPVCRVYQS